jgi:hypothetical protein
MAINTPLADLIHTRMNELGLDRQALGFRLGYQNPLKASGRVHALCEGHITSRRSRAALARLPDALDVAPGVIEKAVAATHELFVEIARQAEEARRRAAEAEEAEWRARFKPHAVVQTELTVPSQITICGLTGGAERWLMIRLDLSKPPVTYIGQALGALPEKVRQGHDGRKYVTFFGQALGIIINYCRTRRFGAISMDDPLRCWRKRIGPAMLHSRLVAGVCRPL